MADAERRARAQWELALRPGGETSRGRAETVAGRRTLQVVSRDWDNERCQPGGCLPYPARRNDRPRSDVHLPRGSRAGECGARSQHVDVDGAASVRQAIACAVKLRFSTILLYG